MGLTFATQMVALAGIRPQVGGAKGGPDLLQLAGAMIFVNLISMLVQIYMMLGQMNFFLKVSRGDSDADFAKIFSGGPWLLRGIGGSILFALIPAILFVVTIRFLPWWCLLLLFVPLVIYLLTYSQFLLTIIDRNLGVIGSFSESQRITKGNRGQLFLTYFLFGLMIFGFSIIGSFLFTGMAGGAAPNFGLLALWFIAVALASLFITPYLWVLGSVCYLIMSGQPTSDRQTRPTFDA